MWFDTWTDLLRVVVAGVSAYAAVVVVLRVSGKRTLAKLNAFDLVVTVAVGSTLATIFLNSDVSIAEGVAALALLAALQFVVASFSSRVKWGRDIVTARPTLLVTHGRLLADELRTQRVSAADVRQAVRSSGQGDLRAVGAVVLESDGSLSVISEDKLGDGSALDGVASARH
ncbi:hypothetical protein CRI77_25925 [Mycolicibacterium duvalii]|uniref:DUF421 domain-containing protein n=1 Tax=Mycolicibacterium duvalii TaxID=39688 RepID=A0A7I7K558_9MYCO|nr:YetF domain-containing protein [Mycolicibacterium duvalii]MCV7367666.1 DUF421 domain-containing protein [Mycolicibacterium duvalii]PEG35106.1 hypothetical protein CRI77_25925 [Mycolicibacterium duvalii]BBX18744.1 DUF421 domain-containing protein [Mycolicibacterium duvalii]